MTTDVSKLIAAAEKEVARVLAKLEADTGAVLDKLEVQTTEVTTLGDSRQQWLRRVIIDMAPSPNTRWDV